MRTLILLILSQGGSNDLIYHHFSELDINTFVLVKGIFIQSQAYYSVLYDLEDIRGLSQNFVDCLRNQPSWCWICVKFDKMSVSCLISRHVY